MDDSRRNWSLSNARDEYVVARRLNNGYDGYDKEGHMPGHGPKIKIAETSVAMRKGIDDELISRSLIGWEAVKGLSLRLAAGKSTLTSSQIPDGLIDKANDVRGMHFTVGAYEKYKALNDELKQMKKDLHIEWAINSTLELKGVSSKHK